MFNLFKKNKKTKEVDIIKDNLVKKHFEIYQKQYPKLSYNRLLKLASHKAEWERDTERLKEEDSLLIIKELELPSILSDLFIENETAKNDRLSDFFRCPTEFFLMTKKEQDAYNVDFIIPIVSDRSFYKIYAYDINKNGFLTYSIEMPEPTINADSIRFTWDGIFVSEILFWWECDIENDDILEFGRKLNLKWVNEILWSIENELDNSKMNNIIQWGNSIYEKYNMIIH